MRNVQPSLNSGTEVAQCGASRIETLRSDPTPTTAGPRFPSAIGRGSSTLQMYVHKEDPHAEDCSTRTAGNAGGVAGAGADGKWRAERTTLQPQYHWRRPRESQEGRHDGFESPHDLRRSRYQEERR